MLLSEFLDLPALENVETACRDSADDFDSNLHQAARIIFGHDLDAVVYSNLKKLTKNPVLRDKTLNSKGLHVFRYVFATYAARHRTGNAKWLEQGHLRIENFLSESQHLQLQQEFPQWDINPPMADCRRIANAHARCKEFAGLDYCMNQSGMRELVLECVGRDSSETRTLYVQNTYLQRLFNQPDDGDEQKDLHSDIFFPAIKWWYFPDEVTIEQGPFRFQTTPPRLDRPMLSWLHQQCNSVVDGSWDRSRRRGHPEGSFRVLDHELQEMDLEVEPITVKANTLILANVQLFHGRGPTKTPHVRNAVHGSIRISQPFLI